MVDFPSFSIVVFPTQKLFQGLGKNETFVNPIEKLRDYEVALSLFRFLESPAASPGWANSGSTTPFAGGCGEGLVDLS